MISLHAPCIVIDVLLSHMCDMMGQVVCSAALVALGGFATAAVASILSRDTGAAVAAGKAASPIVEVASQRVTTVTTRVCVNRADHLAQVSGAVMERTN